MRMILVVSLFIFQAAFACEEKVYEVKSTDKGFEPALIVSEEGVETFIKVTRTSELACSSKVEVPSTKLSYDLPLNKPVKVKLGHLKKGEISFGCPAGIETVSIISVR